MSNINPQRNQTRSTVQRRTTEVFDSHQRPKRLFSRPKRQLDGAAPCRWRNRRTETGR